MTQFSAKRYVPPKAWQERVRDMIAAIAAIQRQVDGVNFLEFHDHESRIHTVLHNLIILGEAANQMPADMQVQEPLIPWGGMRDLRNLLIHEYFRVNLVIVWEIVTLQLPQLAPLLIEWLDRDREETKSSTDLGNSVE